MWENNFGTGTKIICTGQQEDVSAPMSRLESMLPVLLKQEKLTVGREEFPVI
jgi:hypothetical protein